MSYSFFPRSSTVNWNGSSSYNTSGYSSSNVDPYTRTSSSVHRTSSSRYGDRLGYSSYGNQPSYSSYGGGYSSGYRDYRSGSGDAVAGASRYDSERNSRCNDGDYSSSSQIESAYSRFARERAEANTYQSGYGRTSTGEYHRSSNAERDREHATRRHAVAGMYETERRGSRSGYTSGYTYGYGSGYGYDTERVSSSHHSRRDTERQASGGAHQGDRSGSEATFGYTGYRRSSIEGRYAFSPDEIYRYQ